MAANKNTRITIIELLKCGKKPSEICRILKPNNIARSVVYYNIKKFRETGGTDDRKRCGRPRTVRTKKMIKVIAERIRRNPCRSQKKLALQVGMSTRSMSRLLKNDLHMRAYKRHTAHYLNQRLKKIRLERCKRLLRKHANDRGKNILFTDEKIFTIEESYNQQNDRVYARSSKEVPIHKKLVIRAHHPSSVMVWLGVSYNGVTDVHFCQKGVKTNARNYQDDILLPVVLPLSSTMFKNQPWTFQQDSAPAHKAKTTQQWLIQNLPDFIAAEDWPSGSPDLNPLDYKIWSELDQRVCRKPHKNLDSLKRKLVMEAKNLPIEIIRGAIDDWIPRLKAVIKNKGGHIE